MRILVFGNPDQPSDNLALEAAEKVISVPEIQFQVVSPNDDLPLEDGQAVILDTVRGIHQITLITEENLDKFVLSPRNSAHNYDLSFQLHYLKKLGMLREVTVIGLPFGQPVDYDLLHSILRKLAAQDMQGS